MKKYLLFSFGQFNDESVKTILNLVSRFSDNDKMLFQNGGEYLNVQFFSNDSLDNLRDKISKEIDGMTNCQFLFEDYNKNFKDVRNILNITNKEQSLTDYILTEAAKVKIKNDYSEGLKQLDEINKNMSEKLIEYKKKMSKNQEEIEITPEKDDVKEDFNFIQKLDLVIRDFIDDNKTEVNNIEEFECEDEDNDVYITKTVKKEYSIDDILDKINEKGLSSLDKEELNFLNNLSK